MSEIGGDRIRDQLAKVLASKDLEGSDRLCRFLRFIVEARLDGRQDQVKEYLIGKEVFDRNADYDPRLDPIVRVEARRLRKKLDEYYTGAGSVDEVRFELPKGSYVPEFRLTGTPATPAPKPQPSRRLIAVWLAASVVAGGAWAIWKYTRPVPDQQLIAVVPARWIWPSEDFPAIRHDEDVAERVAASLANRHKKSVVSWPAMQRFRDRLVPMRELARQSGATQLLIVAVRVEASGFRVTTYLIDPKLDRKLHVADKERLTLLTASDREQAASVIASEFAGEAHD